MRYVRANGFIYENIESVDGKIAIEKNNVMQLVPIELQSDDIFDLVQEGDLIAHDYRERTRIENVIEVSPENDHQLAVIRTETATFWRYKGGEINLKNIVTIYLPYDFGYRVAWRRRV